MSPTSDKGDGGPFFIHIEGLPVNYTWQDLKDLIRERARHGVWTDMATSSNGRGGGKGFVRMQRRREALSAFVIDGLDNGSLIDCRLNVHLWDISNTLPKFEKCNCPKASTHLYPQQELSGFARLAGNPRSWRDVTPPQSSPSYPAQPISQYSVSYAPPVTYPQAPYNDLMNRMGALHMQQQATQALNQPQYQYPPPNLQQPVVQAQNQSHLYTRSTGGITTNLSQGFALTEQRGIHISNLDYKVSKGDIERKFASAGEIVDCDRVKDPNTGKFKGHATVKYSTAREAANAVEDFDGLMWKDRRLKVKLDKNATVVQAPATNSSPRQNTRVNGTPLVVNGSSGYQNTRKDSVYSQI